MALSKGCTIGLIVAIVVVIVIAILIYFFVTKGPDFLINYAEKEIVRNLPDGYTEETVHKIMEDLRVAYKNDDLSGNQIENLVTAFQKAAADKEIDKEEGRQLLIMIQEALGQEPPDFEEAPAEDMPDTVEAVPEGA